jgi:hypothetical protein
MAEQALKTLPFAQPTQCRRYEGRVAIVTGAAQRLGLVIARRRSRCCRFSYQTGRRPGNSYSALIASAP